jgi:L-threonylcarbamoyladenylate synthase
MAALGQDLKQAKEALEKGGLVAIPTETVYGLAANAFKEESVIKIFEAKNRPSFDPLIVHVSSLSFAEEIVEEIPDSARKLAKAFWPGPLTLVLKKIRSPFLAFDKGIFTPVST